MIDVRVGDSCAVELLSAIRRLARELDELPVHDRDGEVSSARADQVRAGLISRLGEALGHCTRLFGIYFARSETGPAVDTGGNVARRLDALVGSSDIATHVADIIFMGCWEIKQKLMSLEADNSEGTGALMGQCASARRRTIKALCAVEMAISDCEDLTSELRAMYRSELDCALAVRRSFADFREAVALATVSRSTARGQLRGIGVAVARLIGSDGYLFTRAEDRALVAELQARILAWLRSDAASEEAPVAAPEIVRFAGQVVERLRGVNNRVELREHDRRLATAVLRSFLADESATTLPAAVLQQLEQLRGRDDEIDGLLGQGAQPAAPWRAALAELVSPEAEPRWSSSRKIYLRGPRSG